MESIFYAMDNLKRDLEKCGMRLNDAMVKFELEIFSNTSTSFKVVFGLQEESLTTGSCKGDTTLTIQENDYFKKKKRVLIYNIENGTFEYNQIKKAGSDTISLLFPLENDYPENSKIVVWKEVSYKFDENEKKLERRIDRGNLKTMVENVTDFDVTFFPDANALLYRLEVNKREQIRSYIILKSM